MRNGYSTGFKCNDGKCIDAYDVCDCRSDCSEGEDEKICKHQCKNVNNTCTNKIPP